MPPLVVPLANFLVMNTALGIVSAQALATFAIRTVVSFALSTAIGALTKPKQQKQTPDNSLTIRQPDAPQRIIYGEVKAGGVMVYAHSASDSEYLHMVIVFAGHEVESFEEFYFGEDTLTLDGSGEETDKYAGYVTIKEHLGASDQAADADLVAAVSEWTTDHRLRGHAYAYIKLRRNRDLFPRGVPNISAKIRGKKIYDPRTASTAYSANSALCMNDWLTDTKFGLGETYASVIDETTLTAAANVCEESVSLAGGGSEDRYQSNGVLSADLDHQPVLSSLQGSMVGQLLWSHGAWIINAGAYTAPTITLDDDDFADSLSVRTRVPRNQLFNAVRGTYVSEDNNWQPADFPVITNSTYEAQDNGERLWTDIQLGMTTSSAMAQRIAKIALERARQQISVTLPCKLSALKVRAGDTVSVTHSRFGWSSKVFEVEDFSLYQGEQDGTPYFGVNLQCREIASTVFDWSSGEETTVDPAPDTTLPNPFDIGTPSDLVLTSGGDHLLLLNEGSVLARIRATWDAPASSLVSGYEVQYKRSADVDWSAAVTTSELSAYVSPVEDGVHYDVRVRAVNDLGVKSEWTTVLSHSVVGKSDAPTRPDEFTITRLADGTRRFDWTHTTVPADVRAGGGYRIRHYSGSTSDWTSMTKLHDGLLQASPFETNELAAGTYTFAIKSVDSSGNESDTALFVDATIGDPRLKNVLVSRLEHDLGWPGTKTDCLAYGSELIATSSDTINDLPSAISSLASTIGTIGTNNSPIYYETPEIDLGVDASFTPLVTTIADGSVTVEMKTGTDADGGVTGSYAATATVSGKRYIQIRLTVTDTSPRVQQCTILLDGESVIESFEDVDTSSETATWFSSTATGHFLVGARTDDMASITTARIVALQNVGSGWSWELISKAQTVNSKPAAEFKVYNSGGTLADATIDVELKGPKA